MNKKGTRSQKGTRGYGIAIKGLEIISECCEGSSTWTNYESFKKIDTGGFEEFPWIPHSPSSEIPSCPPNPIPSIPSGPVLHSVFQYSWNPEESLWVPGQTGLI